MGCSASTKRVCLPIVVEPPKKIYEETKKIQDKAGRIKFLQEFYKELQPITKEYKTKDIKNKVIPYRDEFLKEIERMTGYDLENDKFTDTDIKSLKIFSVSKISLSERFEEELKKDLKRIFNCNDLNIINKYWNQSKEQLEVMFTHKNASNDIKSSINSSNESLKLFSEIFLKKVNNVDDSLDFEIKSLYIDKVYIDKEEAKAEAQKLYNYLYPKVKIKILPETSAVMKNLGNLIKNIFRRHSYKIIVTLNKEYAEIDGPKEEIIEVLSYLQDINDLIETEDIKNVKDSELSELLSNFSSDVHLFEKLYEEGVEFIKKNYKNQKINSLNIKRDVVINDRLANKCPAATKFYNALKKLNLDTKDPDLICKSGVFGWHGTRTLDDFESIKENNLVPQRRSGQVYGPGEYCAKLADYSQSGYWGSTNKLFLFFKLKDNNPNYSDNYHYVINNPKGNNEMYMVPIIIATFNENHEEPKAPEIVTEKKEMTEKHIFSNQIRESIKKEASQEKVANLISPESVKIVSILKSLKRKRLKMLKRFDVLVVLDFRKEFSKCKIIKCFDLLCRKFLGIVPDFCNIFRVSDDQKCPSFTKKVFYTSIYNFCKNEGESIIKAKDFILTTKILNQADGIQILFLIDDIFDSELKQFLNSSSLLKNTRESLRNCASFVFECNQSGEELKHRINSYNENPNDMFTFFLNDIKSKIGDKNSVFFYDKTSDPKDKIINLIKKKGFEIKKNPEIIKKCFREHPFEFNNIIECLKNKSKSLLSYLDSIKDLEVPEVILKNYKSEMCVAKCLEVQYYDELETQLIEKLLCPLKKRLAELSKSRSSRFKLETYSLGNSLINIRNNFSEVEFTVNDFLEVIFPYSKRKKGQITLSNETKEEIAEYCKEIETICNSIEKETGYNLISKRFSYLFKLKVFRKLDSNDEGAASAIKQDLGNLFGYDEKEFEITRNDNTGETTTYTFNLPAEGHNKKQRSGFWTLKNLENYVNCKNLEFKVNILFINPEEESQKLFDSLLIRFNIDFCKDELLKSELEQIFKTMAAEKDKIKFDIQRESKYFGLLLYKNQLEGLIKKLKDNPQFRSKMSVSTETKRSSKSKIIWNAINPSVKEFVNKLSPGKNFCFEDNNLLETECPAVNSFYMALETLETHDFKAENILKNGVFGFYEMKGDEFEFDEINRNNLVKIEGNMSYFQKQYFSKIFKFGKNSNKVLVFYILKNFVEFKTNTSYYIVNNPSKLEIYSVPIMIASLAPEKPPQINKEKFSKQIEGSFIKEAESVPQGDSLVPADDIFQGLFPFMKVLNKLIKLVKDYDSLIIFDMTKGFEGALRRYLISKNAKPSKKMIENICEFFVNKEEKFNVIYFQFQPDFSSYLNSNSLRKVKEAILQNKIWGILGKLKILFVIDDRDLEKHNTKLLVKIPIVHNLLKNEQTDYFSYLITSTPENAGKVENTLENELTTKLDNIIKTKGEVRDLFIGFCEVMKSKITVPESFAFRDREKEIDIKTLELIFSKRVDKVQLKKNLSEEFLSGELLENYRKLFISNSEQLVKRPILHSQNKDNMNYLSFFAETIGLIEIKNIFSQFLQSEQQKYDELLNSLTESDLADSSKLAGFKKRMLIAKSLSGISPFTENHYNRLEQLLINYLVQLEKRLEENWNESDELWISVAKELSNIKYQFTEVDLLSIPFEKVGKRLEELAREVEEFFKSGSINSRKLIEMINTAKNIFNVIIRFEKNKEIYFKVLEKANQIKKRIEVYFKEDIFDNCKKILDVNSKKILAENSEIYDSENENKLKDQFSILKDKLSIFKDCKELVVNFVNEMSSQKDEIFNKLRDLADKLIEKIVDLCKQS